jgi:hypothetical protein
MQTNFCAVEFKGAKVTRNCSAAAVGLLRALIERAGCGRDWVLLSEIQSIDWQSLSFNGERHRIQLKLLGSQARANADRLTAGLENAELDISGHLVADAVVTAGPALNPFDGTVALTIEALTVEE